MPLMRDIGRKSQGNLIDLGEPDGLTERAFQNIRMIVIEIRGQVQQEDLKSLVMHNALWKISSEPLQTGIDVEALIVLFSRP
jgi:hypothetical protein